MNILGIDIGGTKVSYSIIDSDLNFIHTTKKNNRNTDFRDIVGDMILEIKKNLMEFEFESIGISLPGLIKTKTGEMNLPNLINYKGVNLKSSIEKEFGVKVTLTDDREALVLGEHSYFKNKNMAVIIIGTGIGLGIIINDNVLKSEESPIGAIGWNMVYDKLLSKTARLEDLISGPALAEYTSKLNPNSNINGAKTFFEQVDMGSKLAKYYLEDCTDNLATQISYILNLIPMERIVINGSVGIELFNRSKNELIHKIKELVNPFIRQKFSIESSLLRENAFNLGAVINTLKDKDRD